MHPALTTIILALACLFLLNPGAFAQFGKGLQAQAESYYRDALDSLQSNQPERAEVQLKAALRLLPGDPTLNRYMQLVQERIRKSPGYLMRLRLQRTVLPEVDLREANLTQIVAFLRTASEGRTPDGKPINILFDWPADRLQPRITLSMRRVSLFTIVEYLAELGPLFYRTDEVTLFLSAAPEKEKAPEAFDPFTALSSPAQPTVSPPSNDIIGPPPVSSDPFGLEPTTPAEGPAGSQAGPEAADNISTLIEQELAEQQTPEEDPEENALPPLPEPPPDAPPTEIMAFNPRYTAMLKATRIPSIRLKEAHFVDVLRFITSSADVQLKTGQTGPVPTGLNFVSTIAFLPHSPKISVNLENVPVFDLLVYLAESVQVEMRVDEQAVAFLPNTERTAPKDLSPVLLREYPVTNRKQLIRKLQETRLDSISIFPGDVTEVLQGLRDRLQREGKPSFNIHSHLEEAQPMLLTPLVMDDIPVLHALGYIAENSNCIFRIDPHVVVFLPSEAPTPKPVIERLTDRSDEERTKELRARLQPIVIEDANFPNTPLSGVVQMIEMELEEAGSPSDPPINILLELDPLGSMPMVNLELKQVPVLKLLDYIANQTGIKVRIDPYAIVFVQKPEPPNLGPGGFGF